MIPDPVIKGQGLPGFRRVLPEHCLHGLIISAEMLHESGLVLFCWLPSVKLWLPFHLTGAVQAEYCLHINTPFLSFVDTITRAGERAYLFTHERTPGAEEVVIIKTSLYFEKKNEYVRHLLLLSAVHP